MKVNKLIVSALTILSVSTMGLATVASNADTALAKTKAAKIVKTTTYKAKHKVHVTKGNLYSTAKLTKVSHKAKNYKRTTFYRIKKAKVVKSNKKKAVYNYVKSTNGKTKGWIWHSYVKNGKAPKAKAKSLKTKRNAQGLKKGTANKTAINKLMPDGYTLTKSKKIPGTNIKLKSSKVYTADEDLYMIAKNGHRVYLKPDKPGKTTYRQYATEVIPGLKDPKTKFTNNTGHWIMYSVSGNGIKETDSHGDKDGWSDNGRIAAPIKGYKYFSDLYDPIAGHFPEIGWAINSTGTNATLYNWDKKILINTPSVNKDNLSY
ncbi:hypothetical protein [Levilactobacillus tongjiangensis]|uniref:Surface layer protein A domain-containing protein n=1 Tax=Levilactobacillus tongjiangensis TaxID=2486023 RepID=A0ABW1SS64_9LACO|nr:hypothetical protein [Levilactobacillus tongjiangensis]